MTNRNVKSNLSPEDIKLLNTVNTSIYHVSDEAKAAARCNHRSVDGNKDELIMSQTGFDIYCNTCKADLHFVDINTPKSDLVAACDFIKNVIQTMKLADPTDSPEAAKFYEMIAYLDILPDAAYKAFKNANDLYLDKYISANVDDDEDESNYNDGIYTGNIYTGVDKPQIMPNPVVPVQQDLQTLYTGSEIPMASNIMYNGSGVPVQQNIPMQTSNK